MFSILLKPDFILAKDQFIISVVVTLGLESYLKKKGVSSKIKWPNDLYWKDCKICGTLIETTLQGGHIKDCIIGTGININQQTFRSDAPNPVSLCQILGHKVEREEVLQKVIANTTQYMEMVEAGAWEKIRTLYRHHLYRLEESHRYRFADGREEECKLTNVTDDGHLELLHVNGETYRLAFKEVEFII
jgi:BirA family biotin operon repressor/biotin-[acetyl-CoA-carboxylase] ligase